MDKEQQPSINTALKTSGLLDRRNLKMDKLSPSISGHPVEVHNTDVSPELNRLSPSLERSTRFRHFDHLRSQPATPDSAGKIRCSIPSPLTTETRSVTNSTFRLSSQGSRSSGTSPRSRRSYSDPDPVSHIPDIEVENVDEGNDEQDDNVFKFETEKDHSFLFKATSFVLARGLGRRNERIRNSEPGYNSSTKPHKPKMFTAKKSKKLVIRMPNGELVEGEFPNHKNKMLIDLQFNIYISWKTLKG